MRITVCPYFQQLTPERVEHYAEAGADAVAALFFAFTPDDVARAFDDLEACREAAARGHLRRRRAETRPAAPSAGGARCAACSGRNTPASRAARGLGTATVSPRRGPGIVRRNDPPTPRFILGDEQPCAARREGWGDATGVLPERRPSSGGTTMVLPPGNEGSDGPELTSPLPPTGSGPGAHGVTAVPARSPDRQLDGAWRVWERLRAFDRRYATYVDVALAAGAVRPVLGLGHPGRRRQPEPVVGRRV